MIDIGVDLRVAAGETVNYHTECKLFPPASYQVSGQSCYMCQGTCLTVEIESG